MSLKPKKVKLPRPIDPIFRVPDGAEDEFFVTEESRTGPLESAGLEPVSTPFGVLYQQSNNQEGFTDYLNPPNNLVIFDQKIRRAPGGVVVIDVVTQFDDVPAATRYELRVVKV